MQWLRAAGAAALIALAGCGPAPAGDRDAAPGETIEITAVLHRVQLEGGFWGLVTEDARRYLPLDLREHLDEAPRDGWWLHVRGRVADVETIQMWGTPLQIEDAIVVSKPPELEGNSGSE